MMGIVGQIETDAHTVVTGNIVEGVVMPVADAEVLRLRMVCDIHLYAHHFEVAENQVAACNVEGRHAEPRCWYRYRLSIRNSRWLSY